jgi:hypothetical protein
MAQLVWDQTGERLYETGIDHGVLYLPNAQGAYVNGVAWNGLTSVSEAPSGAESNAQYADNIKYLNLVSAEEFGATLEAFTYPDEFAEFDGLGVPVAGVTIGQQARRPFGLSYRTKVGNDTMGEDYGYKIHLIYGASAAPSEKAYNTINDSPEAITFSWTLTTSPVAVGGNFRPTAQLVVDSTKVSPTVLADLEQILYGDSGVDPALPLPGTVISMFEDGVTQVNPTVPSYNSATDTLTIPSQTGVVYTINGEVVPAGDLVITEDTIVTASPASGYVFESGVDDDWFFNHIP